LICMVIFLFVPSFGHAGDNLFPPAEYVQTKLKQNDIVFLGTTYRKPKVLVFITALLPSLTSLGVTHIGLEIPADQQERIDAFMQTGNGLNNILLPKEIDTAKYRHLFEVLRTSGGPNPVAIDLPFTRKGGSVSNDEWMAQSLIPLLPGKILVIVGNPHIFKKLEWKENARNTNLSVRQYIEREKPETRMWSVGQVIDEDPDQCDFTQVFSQVPDAIALDLDEMVRGWKLGLTSKVAILPAESIDLVDGLIVY